MNAAAAHFESPRLARAVFFAKRRDRRKSHDTSGFERKAQLLLESCHPKQRDYVVDPAKRIATLTAGRAGKTTGAMVRQMVKMLRIKRCRCLFIAKSKPTARELVWEKLKRAWARLGVKPHYSEDRLSCTLRENGSFLRLVGADDRAEIDKLRGLPWHDVVIEESSTHRDELIVYLIEDVIGTRLGDFRGTLELIGTPGLVKFGLFWDLTKPQSELSRPYAEREKYPGWKGWSFHGWSVEDGAAHVEEIRNALEEGLETKEREGWSDTHPTWMREYRGLWAEDDTLMVFRYHAEVDEEFAKVCSQPVGKLWNRWNPERDELGVAVLPTPKGEWHFVVGFDLGGGKSKSAGMRRRPEQRHVKRAGDPTAIEVFAWDDRDTAKRLLHVYEFHSRERLYSAKLAELLLGPELDTEEPEGIFGQLGWPDGMVADLGSVGGMVLEELANIYGLAIEAADGASRHSAIESWNGDLLAGRIWVLEGSVLETQLATLQWEIDEYGCQAKNKRQRDDAADAAIYARSLAYHLLAEAAPEKPKSESRFHSVGKEREPKPKRGPYDDMVTVGVTYYDDSEEWT